MLRAILSSPTNVLLAATPAAWAAAPRFRCWSRPALVLYSFAIGRPMTLLFNAFEIAAIALSVLATSIVVVDGESSWVEGLPLLAVYLILSLALYFVPAPG